MRLWQDLTTEDFEQLDPEKTVVLLPIGAIEQHGPHLPVSTDATIAESLCLKAAKMVPEDVSLLVMPTQDIGKSSEHLQFPGTVSSTADTLMKFWMEIGSSVARSGLRKLVFFNAHGGQPQIMEICCRELRIKHKMMTVGCSGWSFGPPETSVPADERRHGIHAGQVETSIMLYLRPDLVKMEKAENFKGLLADMETEYEHLRVIGSTYMGWVSNDLHAKGCSGNATGATAEIGKTYVDHYTLGLSRLLSEVAEYPLSNIKDRSDW